MARIWSEQSKLARWLDVELAALDGWAELGPEGRWLHYGLTSSDVVDSALSLQIQDAGRLVLGGIDRALTAVAARAEEHRHTICIGRSHGVHAEPTTFGWKLAGWAFELDRARSRVARALETNRVGQLSGTVGTYAQVEPEVERIACERLGLEPDPLSTQVIARDRHAELLCALALAATSLDRFATEIRHLARTEVREVEEPFAQGMKGSSAMPHKRNPKVAERICGLARIVRADAFLALDYMLDRFTWIVEGLVVYPERMRRNLDASHGLVFSHRLLLALVEAGLGRSEAYRLVQANAMRAWDEERDFRELVAADPQIAARLDNAALSAVFDLE